MIPDWLLVESPDVKPVPIENKISRTLPERVCDFMKKNGGRASTRELCAGLNMTQFRQWEEMKPLFKGDVVEYVPGHYRFTDKAWKEIKTHGELVDISRTLKHLPCRIYKGTVIDKAAMRNTILKAVTARIAWFPLR